MGEYVNKNKFRYSYKRFLITIIIFNFAYNAIKLMNSEGKDYPVICALFNMILSLGIFVFIQHKEEIMENKIFKQSLLTDFFKRIK